MRYKNPDTIQTADDPAADAGIRIQGERLRRRYLSNPGVNPRTDVANLNPRFSDIRRGLPLLGHLQRYLPGGSLQDHFSALTLTHPRHLSRKHDRHIDLAIDKWRQPSAAVGQPPSVVEIATTVRGRQSRHTLPANSSTDIEPTQHTEMPGASAHEILLRNQADRLRARYLRTPLTHKSMSARFQRQSVISAKFIPRHLSAMTGHAHLKATQFTNGQHRTTHTPTGKALTAYGIRFGIAKDAVRAAQHKITSAAKPQANGEPDGVVQPSGSLGPSSRVLRQTNATKREADNRIQPKASSTDEPESELKLAATAGRVLAPGSLDDASTRPQTDHRRLQPQRQDTIADNEVSSRIRLKRVSGNYSPTRLTFASNTNKATVNRAMDDAGGAPAAAPERSHVQVEGLRDREENRPGIRPKAESGTADQTVVPAQRQKSSGSAIEDNRGILSRLPLVGPEQTKSNAASIVRLQQRSPAEGSTTSLAQKLMSNSIRQSADNLVQHRRHDDAPLLLATPVAQAQLKSSQTLDRLPTANIPIANGEVPTGSLRRSGVDSAVPGTFSSQSLPVVKSSSHEIEAKSNDPAKAAMSAPRHLLLRRNESHSADGIPLTLARSARVDQRPSTTRSTESFEPASIASQRPTSARDDSEPDPVEAQELKTDELVERVIRKVLRNLSIERERRGWFPWN